MTDAFTVEALERAALTHLGVTLLPKNAPGVLAAGWTPEHYAQMRTWGEQAVFLGSYIAGPNRVPADEKAAGVARALAFTARATAPSEMVREFGSGWPQAVMPWLEALTWVHAKDDWSAIRRSALQMMTTGACWEYDRAVGRTLGPLAMAAGLTVAEAEAQARAGALNEQTLRVLMGLRAERSRA